MATAQPHAERRHFSRLTFHRPADVTVGDARYTCEVLDVSFKGALLEVPSSFPAAEGARCEVRIRLDGTATAIELEGEIVHRRPHTAGVRCTSIDLDSIGHLRRVVEANLGDLELVQRELAALAGRD